MIFERLMTSTGRAQYQRRLNELLWPVFRLGGELYRRTLLRRARVVVIVGTFGKTTTTVATRRATGLTYRTSRSNSFASRALALFRRRPWDRLIVEEVGINGRGQMLQYSRMLRPDVVVMTSVGSEHNRSLGTLEETAQEKAKMFTFMRPGGLAVMNADDPHVRSMADTVRGRILWFSLVEHADVHAHRIEIDWPLGTRFWADFAGTPVEAEIRLLGRNGVRAALAALAVAREVGIPLEQAVTGLKAIAPVPNRMQIRSLPNGAHLIDDCFKSSLETAASALDDLAMVPAHRRILAIGESDNFNNQLNRELGAYAGSRVDQIVALMSRRAFRSFSSGARNAGLANGDILRVDSVRAMTDALRNTLGEGDVVLLKGRNSDRLERVALALEGRTVTCAVSQCRLRLAACRFCEFLEAEEVPSFVARAAHRGEVSAP